MFANQRYENDLALSLFVYIALIVFFNSKKLLGIISHRNHHYTSGL
jgi:hypothetical protein